MIAPSDLNRIPRWAPERLSEDLRRYARSELGAEGLGLRGTVPASGSRPGPFARLAARIRPATPAPSLSLAAPIGAVHFAGGTDTQLRSGASRGTVAACALTTSALVIPAHPTDAHPEEVCTCEL